MAHKDYFMEEERQYLSGNADLDFVYFQEATGVQIEVEGMNMPTPMTRLQAKQKKLLRNIEDNERRVQQQWEQMLSGATKW